MLTTEQFIAKNGLLKPEAFHLKHVIEADMTHFPACYPDELLTDEQRRKLRELATVTKMTACEIFSISPAKFDAAKRQHPIRQVTTRWARNRRGVLYIYALQDVIDMLTKAGMIKP